MANKKDTKTSFVCDSCGKNFAKWTGQCDACKAWNTIVEYTEKSISGNKSIIASGNKKPLYLDEIKDDHVQRFTSGMSELDRAIGGGIVPGGFYLIGGEPGKGKSTLLLQIASFISEQMGEVIYFSGEESEHQTKMLAQRLGINPKRFRVLHTKDMDTIELIVEEEKPFFIVIDSIQAIGDSSIASEPGSPAQVKNCTSRLVHIAKGKGVTVFLVGQVTKDTQIAGPKMLEHMVDAVLYLEGEKYNDLRLLRINKNRFGSANELGVFQMLDRGLVELKNPSEFLLSNRQKNANGSVVVAISDTRPLLIEVQALCTPVVATNAPPRRTSEGYSRNRLQLIIAILEKMAKIPLGTQDVFVNVVGGMEIEEPGADLGVALSILSSYKNKSIDPQTVVLGEMGLSGEIRPVGHVEQMVREAAKVGFTSCVLPKKNYEQLMDLKNKQNIQGIQLKPVETIQQAIATVYRT